jgi:lipopolysaccharide biosynthesis glycosyltransferase
VPNLRLILRGGWSDYDDAAGVAGAVQLGACSRSITELRNYVFAKELLTDSPKNDSLAIPAPPASRYAIFACGDSKAVIPSIVALKSFGDKLSAPDIYYITDACKLSSKLQILLDKFNISLIHTNYSDQFTVKHVKHSSKYVYNQFIAPELLLKYGFEYSIGIQYDTLCIKKFDVDSIFKETRYFSGTNNSPDRRYHAYMYPDSILKKYNFSSKSIDKIMINPGILFINNIAVSKMCLSEKFLNLYNNIGYSNIILEDESVLNALFMCNDEFINIVSYEYNTLVNYEIKNKPYCIHFDAKYKPWEDNKHCYFMTPTRMLYTHIWRETACCILGHTLYRQFMLNEMEYV